MNRNEILQGDCRELVKTLPSDSIDCVITSPPYLWLRDYGVEGQIGLEKSMQEYLETMWGLFDEIKRILKPTGTVWVNLGDTYSKSVVMNNNGQGSPETFHNGTKNKQHTREPIAVQKQIQDKSLMGIPDRFKIGMIDRGWICRNEIIWWKRNAMPSSAKDRFTVDFEKLYFFVKSNTPQLWVNSKTGKSTYKKPPTPKTGIEGIDWEWQEYLGKKSKETLWEGKSYYFETQYEPYSEATMKEIQKPYTGQATKVYEGTGAQNPSDAKRSMVNSIRKNMPKFGGNKAEGYGNPTYSGKEWNPQTFGRLKRTVWDIPTKPFSEAHFATYPEELVSNCIKAGCPESICTKCGTPRTKTFNEERINTRPGLDTGNGKSGTEEDPNNELHNSDLSKFRQQIIRHENGYSQCNCGAEFKPGIVLDPFFGSGTTGVAAMKLGRDWLGLELNPQYIEIAKKRLAPLMQQSRLL